MIKKLDLFIIRSFVMPLAATFFVSLTVLLLQFLWKYLEDLAGKGLEWYIILEFLVYSTANLIPMALPLAVLLASIMTFGNFGEKYELVSIKAAGIPLRRAFMPLTVIVILLSAAAFLFSVRVIHVANLKWGALYYDLMQQKPAFELKEGVFYNDIEGYSIKVAHKKPDGSLNDIIIYDHTKDRGNTTVITANSGRITHSEDQRYLHFTLYNGQRYEDMIDQPNYQSRLQHNVMSFESHEIIFDLSRFKLSRTDIDLFKDFWRYKSMPELRVDMDSLNRLAGVRNGELVVFYKKNYHFDKQPGGSGDPVPARTKLPLGIWDPDSLVNSGLRKEVIAQALLTARTAKGQIENSAFQIDALDELRAKHEVAWHQKITLSVACFVMFLIGAPLGAIVRKGGFGTPVVFSILFFLLFLILNMNGEKMVKQLILDAPTGMWMANLILAPIGLWLTVKATRDSALFDLDAYFRFLKRLGGRKAK